MIIKAVRIQNLCSIRDETVALDELTALVGPNGSGKSALLRALGLFFSTNPRVAPDDFYDGDATANIEVTITFAGLTAPEAERFESRIENDELTVTRVLSLQEGRIAKYHGSALQNPEFNPVRQALGAPAQKAAYEALRENARYATLPKWKRKEDAFEALKVWELANVERCVRQQDDGQFFGFSQVGQGYLGRHTRFLLIPAVRDAADDAAEGKSSPTSELLDLVVRSTLATREDLRSLKEEADHRYKAIMEPLTELQALEKQLTETLSTYAPSAGVSIAWTKSAGIEIPMPGASVRLIEDGYVSSVDRCGHGLQRAFIVALLQCLAVARGSAEASKSEPAGENPDTEAVPVQPSSHLDLILAIEEPELYQHPSRQRHLANVLLGLAIGGIPGVAARTQVIYATHSPLFVGLDRFDQIRLLRKCAGAASKPGVTKVVWTTMDAVASDLAQTTGGPPGEFTAASLRSRLHAIMTPWMNEGFFADAVVLVEGEDDRAAILAAANLLEHDLEASGISVIPCMGKNNLDRPALIFRKLQIPTYVVWDSDKGNRDQKPELNRRLLRLHGVPEEDWPAMVTDQFACFEKDLSSTLKEELGGTVYESEMSQAQVELGIPDQRHAEMNVGVMRKVMEGSREKGISSPTLTKIVTKIITLKPMTF